jgi:hypothetical protein
MLSVLPPRCPHRQAQQHGRLRFTCQRGRRVNVQAEEMLPVLWAGWRVSWGACLAQGAILLRRCLASSHLHGPGQTRL